MYDFNKKIYDNGRMLLGKTSIILNYINRRLSEDPLDEDTTEFYVELKDELLNYNMDHILIINYDHPMGYDITVFKEEDKIYG